MRRERSVEKDGPLDRSDDDIRNEKRETGMDDESTIERADEQGKGCGGQPYIYTILLSIEGV